ncbi:MAG: DUF4214 domain-containing protein [Candidatus Doudnabacteria bacterium]|nr:DUF4214 domain-containing protein [Candidatus Doudnabacteria bacterium]
MFSSSPKLRQRLGLFSTAVLVLSMVFGSLTPLVSQALTMPRSSFSLGSAPIELNNGQLQGQVLAASTPPFCSSTSAYYPTCDLRISSSGTAQGNATVQSNFPIPNPNDTTDPAGFTATAGSLVNGKWIYTFTWSRRIPNRKDYIYVSQPDGSITAATTKYYITAEFPSNVDITNSSGGLNSAGTVTSGAVFAPNTLYRLTFYSYHFGSSDPTASNYTVCATSNCQLLRAYFLTPDTSVVQSAQGSGASSSGSGSGTANGLGSGTGTGGSTANTGSYSNGNACNSNARAAAVNSNGLTFYQEPVCLTDFLQDVYTVLYNRQPDSSGQAFWINYLTSSTANFTTFYENMFNQAEYTGKNKTNQQFLTDAFRVILYRSPDSGGQAFWLNALNTGTSKNTLISNLVSSAEFTTSGAGGNPAMQKVLNSDIFAYGAGSGVGVGSGTGTGNGTGIDLTTCVGLNQAKVIAGAYQGLTCAQALAQQTAFTAALGLTQGVYIPQNIITQAINISYPGGSDFNSPAGPGRTYGPQGPVNTWMRICVNHGVVGPVNGGTVETGSGNDPCTVGSDEAFVGNVNFDGQLIAAISPRSDLPAMASNAPGLAFRIPSVLPDGTNVTPGVHHITVSQGLNGQQVNISPAYAITVTTDLPGCGQLPFGSFSGSVAGSLSSPPCLETFVNPVSTGDGSFGKLFGTANGTYTGSVQALVFCNSNQFSADATKQYNNCLGPWTITMDGATLASNVPEASYSAYAGSNMAEVDFSIPNGTSFGAHDISLTNTGYHNQTTNTSTVFVNGATYSPPTPVSVPYGTNSAMPTWTPPVVTGNGIDMGCSASSAPSLSSINGGGTSVTAAAGSTITLKGNCFSAYNNEIGIWLRRLSCTTTNLSDGGLSNANCSEQFGVGPVASSDGQTLTFKLPSGILAGEVANLYLGNNAFPVSVLDLVSQQGTTAPISGTITVK